MSDGANSDDYEVGYGKPSKTTQFKKGQRANPNGRPRGRRNDPPYEAVLGQMVTIREDGVEREVTAAEAFLLKMIKQGIEGDGVAARSMMAMLEEARASQQLFDSDRPHIIENVLVDPGSVNPALRPLRMARKLDRFRETARMALEPWIVEAALERLGDFSLAADEQRTVIRATRTPNKVKWPYWWEVIE